MHSEARLVDKIVFDLTRTEGLGRLGDDAVGEVAPDHFRSALRRRGEVRMPYRELASMSYCGEDGCSGTDAPAEP